MIATIAYRCSRPAENATRLAIGFSLIVGFALSFLPGNAALADDGAFSMTRTAPRWAVEVKGGLVEPDLPEYKRFYGSDDNGIWGLTGAFRFYNWLEVAAELNYSSDNGTGFLPSAGTPGGKVKYTLVPAQLVANFRYNASFDQMFVPYLGVGVTAAWYRQTIDPAHGSMARHADDDWSARRGTQRWGQGNAGRGFVRKIPKA
jgi:opacity protein-like surface antigen